jgi:hypothetical protein
MKNPELILIDSDPMNFESVKYNPEISNIENIVAVYSTQTRISPPSPPYSKKSIISMNSPKATIKVGINSNKQNTPKM